MKYRSKLTCCAILVLGSFIFCSFSSFGEMEETSSEPSLFSSPPPFADEIESFTPADPYPNSSTLLDDGEYEEHADDISVDASNSSRVIENISSWQSSYKFNCETEEGDCPLIFKAKAMDSMGIPLGIEIEGEGFVTKESNRVDSLKVKYNKPEETPGAPSENKLDEDHLKNTVESDMNAFRQKQSEAKSKAPNDL